MGNPLKPWYAARWETLEPEEEERFPEDDYNEPTNNELIDMEFGYEFPE